jgi:hypothetical protein
LKLSRTVGAEMFSKLSALSLFSRRKRQAINYAQNRASFRSGEIRILDSSGDVERIIPFTEAERKLSHPFNP